MLSEIGQKLDQHIFPLVCNGGIVIPNDTTIPSLINSEENSDDKRQRQDRSKARSRERATRWQREVSEHGETSPPTQAIGTSLKNKYVEELDAINESYPGSQVWQQKEGMWLLCQSALLPDTLHSAVFLCAIPFEPTKLIRSWGFWHGCTWIGPRHTNLPDGSICAFEPSDFTWTSTDPMIKLLDIYTLWAVRHLYLQTFGYWPGAQVAHYAYERLTELKAGELCGCGSLEKNYGECCRDKDLKRNRISDAIKFISLGGANRKPPEAVMRFIKERKNPPSILGI